MKRITTATLAVMLFIMLNSAWAEQLQATVDPEFAGLQRVLKTKDKVTVTLADGTEIKGRLTDIFPDRIVVNTTRSFTPPQIVRVQQKKNGILLGALIGLGASIPFAAIANEYANNESAAGGTWAVAIIGSGTAIGLGIDALIPGSRTVYDRRPGKHLSALPILDRNGTGLRLALTF